MRAVLLNSQDVLFQLGRIISLPVNAFGRNSRMESIQETNNQISHTALNVHSLVIQGARVNQDLALAELDGFAKATKVGSASCNAQVMVRSMRRRACAFLIHQDTKLTYQHSRIPHPRA